MINNYKELEQFLYNQIKEGKSTEFNLNSKWFFFLIRLIRFTIEGKKVKDDYRIIKFNVHVNNVKCKIYLKT